MNQVFKRAYGFDKTPDKKLEDFIIKTFLPYSEANKKTFYDDVLICRVLIKEFEGKSLRQITVPLIEEFKQIFNQIKVRGTKRSPATVNRHLSIFSKIFSMAVDADLIEDNVCRRVKKLPLNNQRMRVLSNDEEDKLFDALTENKLVKNTVITALHTEMRRSEIFNLKWFDVDFSRRVIQIRESKSNKKRFVPINETLLDVLQNLRRKSEYVFPSPFLGGRLGRY